MARENECNMTAAYIRNSLKIKGYNIPNTRKTVKIKLYADNTTIYLASTDKYCMPT